MGPRDTGPRRGVGHALGNQHVVQPGEPGVGLGHGGRGPRAQQGRVLLGLAQHVEQRRHQRVVAQGVLLLGRGLEVLGLVADVAQLAQQALEVVRRGQRVVRLLMLRLMVLLERGELMRGLRKDITCD